MVDFAGYSMPQQYGSIREEHLAVRGSAGLFDISHMGEVRLRGPGAHDTVARLCANDVDRLRDGQAMYGVMCRPDGGIVDDIIVYRDGAEDYMVVVNAACREKDLAWMRSNLAEGTELTDESDETALLALQGPDALAIAGPLLSEDCTALRPFHCTMGTVAGVPARISRTGYTGEDGLELYVSPDGATTVWDAITRAGGAHVRRCGLGARDTLRLEAGLRLYGQDMDETRDPISCGLGWTVKLDRPQPCIGADVLRQRRTHPPTHFIGLSFEGRAIPRHGQTILADGRPVGEVTSGGYGFTLGHGIATGYVPPEAADASRFEVEIRGVTMPATRVPLPFYRRPQQQKEPHRA
jgi:aminomethyltransferase